MASSLVACFPVASAPGRGAPGSFVSKLSESGTKPWPVKASMNQNEQRITRIDPKRPLSSRRWRNDPAFDAWDPFSAGSLKQMIDTVDRLFDTTFNAGTPGSLRSGIRTPWDVIEDGEGFHLRVDLPGFSKDDVKVMVEDEVLTIKAERQADTEEPDRWKSRSIGEFKTQVALPDNVSLEEIKAEMKNGVLTVTVPKVKREEKKSVIDLKIL